MSIKKEYANKPVNLLEKETSLYLLQHANNPVHWMPWDESAFKLAREQDKLMIISIGYSSCHWCHVMEKECFEDDDVAAFMNKHFISIKVDREERPDVDQAYMSALQLMNGQGGWPLNCICLPDGRPIFGGTYFPKQSWLSVLDQVNDFYNQEKDKAYEYAQKLEEGMEHLESLQINKVAEVLSGGVLDRALEKWKTTFDDRDGGYNRVPKFPLPNTLSSLLRCGVLKGEVTVTKFVHKTLLKMANGGIWDQLGGGFARYSTDAHWKIPHFEKMLYDNAQMLQLYSQAYSYSKTRRYKEVVFELVEFLKRDMLSEDGLFYSSIDADSEGEEGKFYSWSLDELKKVLKGDYELANALFAVESKGHWEQEKYVILHEEDEALVARTFSLSEEELISERSKIREKLLEARKIREKPIVDRKCITSWNALTIKGLLAAFDAFKDSEFLELAINCAKAIERYQIHNTGLFRIRERNVSTVGGLLDDYAYLIDAYAQLSLSSGDLHWIHLSRQLLDKTIDRYYDKNSGYFWYNDNNDEQLFFRSKEVTDDVIPASNSVMAHNLHLMAWLFNEPALNQISEKMLLLQQENIQNYPASYSNWIMLLLKHVEPFYEVLIVGKDAMEARVQMLETHIPPKAYILVSEVDARDLPVLEGKRHFDRTAFYICKKGACLPPVFSLNEAVAALNAGSN